MNFDDRKSDLKFRVPAQSSRAPLIETPTATDYYLFMRSPYGDET